MADVLPLAGLGVLFDDADTDFETGAPDAVDRGGQMDKVAEIDGLEHWFGCDLE